MRSRSPRSSGSRRDPVRRNLSFDRAFAFEPGQFVMVWVPAWTRCPWPLVSELDLGPARRRGHGGPLRAQARRPDRLPGRTAGASRLAGTSSRSPAGSARPRSCRSPRRAGRDVPPRRPDRGRAPVRVPARGRGRPPARHRRRLGRAPRLRRGPPRRRRPRVVRRDLRLRPRADDGRRPRPSRGSRRARAVLLLPPPVHEVRDRGLRVLRRSTPTGSASAATARSSPGPSWPRASWLPRPRRLRPAGRVRPSRIAPAAYF